MLRLRYLVLLLFIAGLAATVYLYNHVPTAFLPTEDQNYLICLVQTPPGASLTYTARRSRQGGETHPPEQRRLRHLCRHGIQSHRRQLLQLRLDLCSANVGRHAQERGPGPYGLGYLPARLSPQLFGVPGGLVAIFEPPAIQGLGNFGGFAFELQDSGRNTLQDLDRVAHQIIGASRQDNKLVGLYTSYTASDPQLLVNIDREKAKAHGRIAHPDQFHSERFHGFCVRQRFQLQQPLLSGLRAGQARLRA